MIEFLEIKNSAEYNPLLISKKAPFTQGLIYGKWQKMASRKVRIFEVKQGEEIIVFFQVIKYELPFSKNLLYIPHGPVFKTDHFSDDEFLKEFRGKLSEIAREENAIFVRFDFYFHNFNYESKENLSKYFKKVPSYAYHSFYFQPKFEWIINLDKTEEELLKAMHPKTRYNIRLAEKKGVKIEIVKNDFKKYFEKFFDLLKETAKRDDFSLHPKIYYKNIFETLDSSNAFLSVARYDDNILLVNFIFLYGKTAYFVFGGSSDKLKNLMFSHLAHWESIKEAKTRGLVNYNFGGVQGSDKDYQNYEGISVFKKRFGGEFLEYSDSYDLILKPFWYWLYNLRKKLSG